MHTLWGNYIIIGVKFLYKGYRMRIFLFHSALVVVLLAGWSSSQKEGDDTVQIMGTVQAHNQEAVHFKDVALERSSSDHELLAYGAPTEKDLIAPEQTAGRYAGRQEDTNPHERIYTLANNPKDVEFRIDLRHVRRLQVADDNTVYQIKAGAHASRRYTKIKIEMAEPGVKENEVSYFLVPEETRLVFTVVPKDTPFDATLGKKSGLPMKMYVKAIRNLEITGSFIPPKRSEDRIIMPGMQCTVVGKSDKDESGVITP